MHGSSATHTLSLAAGAVLTMSDRSLRVHPLPQKQAGASASQPVQPGEDRIRLDRLRSRRQIRIMRTALLVPLLLLALAHLASGFGTCSVCRMCRARCPKPIQTWLVNRLDVRGRMPNPSLARGSIDLTFNIPHAPNQFIPQSPALPPARWWPTLRAQQDRRQRLRLPAGGRRRGLRGGWRCSAVTTRCRLETG